MKNTIRAILFSGILLGTSFIAYAQEPTQPVAPPTVAELDSVDPVDQDTVKYWKYDGNVAVNLNQVALKNWAGGGQNAIGINGIFNLKASYEKGKFSWDVRADMAFGTQKIGKQGFRKSDDYFEIGSQLNYKLAKGWKFSVLKTLRSQFAKGYEYPDDTTRTLTSKGFSPAYTIFAPGIEYTAPKYFKLMISPATNKNNIVMGNTNIDETRYGVEEGKRVFVQFGAYLTASFDATIWKNVTYGTKLDLFSNYLENPGNIDINWSNKISMKVNDYLQVTLTTDLIYDDDVMVPKEREDGSIYEGKGTQFRQNLAIGIGYKFKRE